MMSNGEANLFNFVNHFHFQVIPKCSDYIILHGTNIHSDPLPYALSIVELLGIW